MALWHKDWVWVVNVSKSMNDSHLLSTDFNYFFAEYLDVRWKGGDSLLTVENWESSDIAFEMPEAYYLARLYNMSIL